MRHERFDRIFSEQAPIVRPAAARPGLSHRLAGWIAGRLANWRRPDLRDLSEAQLRDIGLTRHDIERF